MSRKWSGILGAVIFQALLYSCVSAPPRVDVLGRSDAISRYLTRSNLDPIEGIWVRDEQSYELAIAAGSEVGVPEYDFVGFVVDPSGESWRVGSVVLGITGTNVEGRYTGKCKSPNGFVRGAKIGVSGEEKLTVLVGSDRAVYFKTFPKKDGTARGASTGEAFVSGTGWLCQAGYIVTCAHIVDGADSISIVTDAGRSMTASVEVLDRANDIALLNPGDPSQFTTCIALSQESPSMGTSVVALGFPHPDIMGESMKLSTGTVAGMTGFRGDPRTYQIAMPVQSGVSGAPLLNINGEAVGIVTSKLDAVAVFGWTGDLPESVSYAVKSGYLRLLLENAEGPSKFTAAGTRGLELPMMIEKIRRSVVHVTAE